MHLKAQVSLAHLWISWHQEMDLLCGLKPTNIQVFFLQRALARFSSLMTAWHGEIMKYCTKEMPEVVRHLQCCAAAVIDCKYSLLTPFSGPLQLQEACHYVAFPHRALVTLDEA